MSGGDVCKCSEAKKPIEKRDWIVIQYKSNRSAFNGYRRVNSEYSCINCLKCNFTWRTKAKYVDVLKNLEK